VVIQGRQSYDSNKLLILATVFQRRKHRSILSVTRPNQAPRKKFICWSMPNSFQKYVACFNLRLTQQNSMIAEQTWSFLVGWARY
jgi:hypothetical protein